jgi:hypothetical protein
MMMSNGLRFGTDARENDYCRADAAPTLHLPTPGLGYRKNLKRLLPEYFGAVRIE